MMLRTPGLLLALIVISASACRSDGAEPPTPEIAVNTVGFLPDAPKAATIARRCDRFAVVDAATGEVAFAGAAMPHPASSGSDSTAWIADFSVLQTPGRYRVRVDGVGASPPFSISRSAWNRPFYLAMRGMYLWRCGMAVRDNSLGIEFVHAACHLDDARLDHVDPTQPGKAAPGVGGWHDAGDYNKYVVNGAFTAGMMLQAWLQFEHALAPLDLQLPDGDPTLPDFLEEVKWEIDWLLSMQAADGRVYHKLSTEDFGGFILPEQETAPRFFCPWGSAATADLVAIAALASRVYRPYDADFADRCLAAARLSHGFLQAHPDDHRPDQSAFTTGRYDSPDADDRLWAAAELWAATGEATYRQSYEECVLSPPARGGRSRSRPPSIVDDLWDWGNVANLAAYTYLLAERPDRDPQVVTKLRNALRASADRLLLAAQNHPYARTHGERYYWGCNGGIARQTMTLMLAYRVTRQAEYRRAAQQSLAYLFGRNPYARSFVTGVGFNPPRFPHDRRSGGDAAEAPWPGYLVGGPWPTENDWHDDQDDYRTNEIAVNWNGALIYALAAFVEPDTFDAAN